MQNSKPAKTSQNSFDIQNGCADVSAALLQKRLWIFRLTYPSIQIKNTLSH